MTYERSDSWSIQHAFLSSIGIYIFSARSHTHAEQTSQEVKKEVEQNLKDMETLERSLPSTIAIGPFLVRVEAVRQALCNKRKALGHAMLQHFTRKLRKQIDNVSHLYVYIHTHVCVSVCVYK